MLAFPESLLDSSEQHGIRTVALALLRDAIAERDRLATAPDEEALHDFRVAVRRLRSWLRAHREVLGRAAGRRIRRALRRVAQATNVSRDAEVLAAWLIEARAGLDGPQQLGADWVLREVSADHPRCEGGVVLSDEVQADFDRAVELLEERLPVFTMTHHLSDGVRELPFGAAMAAGVRRHAATLRRRLARVGGADDDTLVHRARIAGKRLRYLLEPVAPHLAGGLEVIERLKLLQDTLGEVHDSHVWLEDLGRRIERHGVQEARRLASATLLDTAEAPVVQDVRPGVTALTRGLRRRVRDRYAAYVSAWDEPATAAFFGEVERMAAVLDHHGLGGVEIERKYLLHALPEHVPEGEVWVIEQGYVPGDRLVERLRRVRSGQEERFYRTVKSGTGVARLELEEETSREVFEEMWPLTAGRRISKRRHRVPDGDMTWELDEFTDRDLVLAEVELRHIDDEVPIPEWLAAAVVREVTGEPEYLNMNLAR